MVHFAVGLKAPCNVSPRMWNVEVPSKLAAILPKTSRTPFGFFSDLHSMFQRGSKNGSWMILALLPEILAQEFAEKKPGEEIPDVLQERSQSPCPWIAVQWSLTSESNTNGMLDMWAARRGFKSRRSLNCKEGQGGTLAMKSRELGFLFGILGTTNSFDSKDRMNTLNLVDSLDSLHMNGYPKDR